MRRGVSAVGDERPSRLEASVAGRALGYLKRKGPVDAVRAARSRIRDRRGAASLQREGQRVEWGQDVRGIARLVIRGPGLVVVGDRCVFRDAPRTILHTLSPDAVIRLGPGCSLVGTAITAATGLSVGAGALLGQAYISDTDFHSIQRNRRDPTVPGLSAPIELGANVWVATGANIYKGVTVGDHSVIGAQAVVRQSVPPDVVVIGNPQQIVGHLDPDIEPYWP